jgi:cytochrome c-type biogenesis protein
MMAVRMSFDAGFLGALLAGLLSFASPCVLPLVPPYLCYLAGVGMAELSGSDTRVEPRATRLRIFRQALFFVLGFSTVFVLLGATATLIGQTLTRYLDWLSIGAGVLIIGMGLHFLGVFRIALLYREARVSVERQPAGPFGAYLMGLAFAFGWTPCVGPVLAAILMVAGTGDTALRGAGLLAAYSAGIGIPFLAAAALAGPFLALMGRMKRHLGMIEKIMGGLLVLTGLLFLTGRMPEIANWLLTTFPVLGQIG